MNSGDSAWWNSTKTVQMLSSPATDVPFNPWSDEPLFMELHFSDTSSPGLNLYWVKIYYSAAE